MLGILLVYFIGKSHYQLAERFEKKPWPYAILAVVLYYLGVFGGGLLLGIVLAFTAPEFLENANEFVLGLLCIPIGLLVVYGSYKYFEHKWEREFSTEGFDPAGELLDAEFIQRK